MLQSEREVAGLIAVGGSLSALPPWYIAPHRIQLGKFLASGSFGAVCEGTYEETPVMANQLLSAGELASETRRQFVQEADLWLSIEHPFVLGLFGACHDGWPLFVCEQATDRTIVEVASREEDPSSM